MLKNIKIQVLNWEPKHIKNAGKNDQLSQKSIFFHFVSQSWVCIEW